MRDPASFNRVAALYHRGRPSYPDALKHAILAEAAIGPGSRVLDVGCGTGQVSVCLAAAGARLLAMDYGDTLADMAKDLLLPYPNARVQVQDFNTWSIRPASFDCIVVACAFHWLDPKSRLERCNELLAPGGRLLIVDVHWAVQEQPDEFFRASQNCYQKWDPEHDPDYSPPSMADLPGDHAELSASALFQGLRLTRYPVQRSYSTQAYLDLLGSFSNVIGLAENRRRGFLQCMGSLLRERFNGQVTRKDVYDLWMVEKAAR